MKSRRIQGWTATKSAVFTHGDTGTMTPAPGRSRFAMRAALVLTLTLVLAAFAGCINRPATQDAAAPPSAEPLAGASTTQPSPTPSTDPGPSPSPSNGTTSGNSTTPTANATAASSNATSANATAYHDEAEYVAGAGQVGPDPTSCRDAAHPPAPSPTDQFTRAPGGVCWKLPAGVTQIQNLLITDVAPHDILTDIQQMDASGKMLKETTFCTLAKNVPLVDGAKIVSIVVGAGDSSKCAPPPAGVSGVISIRFE